MGRRPNIGATSTARSTARVSAMRPMRIAPSGRQADYLTPRAAGSPSGSGRGVGGPDGPRSPRAPDAGPPAGEGLLVAPPALSPRPPGSPACGPSAWPPFRRYDPLDGLHT